MDISRDDMDAYKAETKRRQMEVYRRLFDATGHMRPVIRPVGKDEESCIRWPTLPASQWRQPTEPLVTPEIAGMLAEWFSK